MPNVKWPTDNCVVSNSHVKENLQDSIDPVYDDVGLVNAGITIMYGKSINKSSNTFLKSKVMLQAKSIQILPFDAKAGQQVSESCNLIPKLANY